jgi:hypothetical protein
MKDFVMLAEIKAKDGSLMQQLTTHLLSRVCRIFLELAYPEGPSTIPVKKRLYFDIPSEQPIEAFLPPSAGAVGVCQARSGDTGELCGYDFRLGSSHFQHLKLRLQLVNVNNVATWVAMVDTHDAFSKDTSCPPADHPDAQVWLQIQNANRALKQKIEAAFEQNNVATFNSILRDGLNGGPDPEH